MRLTTKGWSDKMLPRYHPTANLSPLTLSRKTGGVLENKYEGSPALVSGINVNVHVLHVLTSRGQAQFIAQLACALPVSPYRHQPSSLAAVPAAQIEV